MYYLEETMHHQKLLLTTSALALALSACGDGNNQNQSTVTPDGQAGQAVTISDGSSHAASTTTATTASDNGETTTAVTMPFALTHAQEVQFSAEFNTILGKIDQDFEIHVAELAENNQEEKEAAQTAQDAFTLRAQEQLRPFIKREFFDPLDKLTEEYNTFNVAGDLTVPSNPQKPWADLIEIQQLINKFSPENLDSYIRTKINKLLQSSDLTRPFLGTEFYKLSPKETIFNDLLSGLIDPLNTKEKQYVELVDKTPKDSHFPENLDTLANTVYAATDQKLHSIFDNKLYVKNFTQAVTLKLTEKFVFAYSGPLNQSTEEKMEREAPYIQKTTKNLVYNIVNPNNQSPFRAIKFSTDYNSFYVKGSLLAHVGVPNVTDAGVYALNKVNTFYPEDGYSVQPLSLTERGGYSETENVHLPDGETATITEDVHTRIQTEFAKILITAMKQSYRGWKTMRKINSGAEKEPWWEFNPELDADGNPIVAEINPFAGLFDGLDLDGIDTTPSVSALAAGMPTTLSHSSSRNARVSSQGALDLRAFSANGNNGQLFNLNLPVHISLTGGLDASKSTSLTSGTASYKLGNTLIGISQGYANSGNGFEANGSQFESSALLSHSWKGAFIEAQFGSVSATNLHDSAWEGSQSMLTLGVDTNFYLSPFVQFHSRTLNRDQLFTLNDTTVSLGLELDIAKLTIDSYSIDTRLVAKAGYGTHHWSNDTKDIGSTRGFDGSVEWSGSLNLHSGVSFTSNLSLGSNLGASTALNFSLNR